jgi:hypothetical protein
METTIPIPITTIGMRLPPGIILERGVAASSLKPRGARI